MEMTGGAVEEAVYRLGQVGISSDFWVWLCVAAEYNLMEVCIAARANDVNTNFIVRETRWVLIVIALWRHLGIWAGEVKRETSRTIGGFCTRSRQEVLENVLEAGTVRSLDILSSTAGHYYGESI